MSTPLIVAAIRLSSLLAQATDDGFPQYLALIGAVLVATIGAVVTIVVAWRNNANQRSLSNAAVRAEADRMRAEQAASATESALQANSRLISSLQEDNDHLRQQVTQCESTCSAVRRELRAAEDRIDELEDAGRVKDQRISELEAHVARLEGTAL